ncbi:MAG: hypothetical protein ABIH49_02065 [archaeon]
MKKTGELVLVLLGVFVVFSLIYFLPFFNITGKVAMNFNSVYEEGQPLNGNLNLVLKEGELIPASSKIIFETNGEKYEYNLGDVLSEAPVSGDFYLEGISLSGNGNGFGIEGTKDSEEVYFAMKIFSDSENTEPSSVEENIPEASTNETTPENNTEISNESESNNETSVQEEITPQENTENTEEIIPSEEPVEETIPAEDSSPETTAEETNPEAIPAEQPVEENPQPETENIITAGVIKIFNSFRGLTGNAVLNLETTIEGRTSRDNPFTYTLSNGETAEIVSGSVKTSFSDLSDSDVNLILNGNEVTVTTDYSDGETGFGEEYLGTSEKKLPVILSNLNLVFPEGELKITLVYDNQEISSVTTSLQQGEVNATTESEILNESINKTLNESKPEKTLEIPEYILTDSEKNILLDEFGNSSVEITSAEKQDNGIVVRFEIGNYWVEHTYDLSLSENELREKIEADKNKWLKDLVNSLSERNREYEKIDNLIGSYEI